MGEETAEGTGGRGERPTDDGDAGPTATRRSVLGLVAGAVGVGVGSSRARATETDTDAGPTVVGFGYGGVPLTDGDAGEEREFRSSASDGETTGETRSLAVVGTGSKTTYEFSVSGEVVSGARLSGWDSFSGGDARGAVWGAGRDEYSFSGSLTDLSVSGDATVLLDGSAVDPADYTGTSGSPTAGGRTASPEEAFGYGEGGYGGTL